MQSQEVQLSKAQVEELRACLMRERAGMDSLQMKFKHREYQQGLEVSKV